MIGPKMLAEDDPMKMEMDIIDEQVDTVGRVFMGLTIGCARCHDHKFDPIPTADYYSLAGIFKSTKSMRNHKVVAMWNERALATDEDAQPARGAHKKEVARREAEIKARRQEGWFKLGTTDVRSPASNRWRNFGNRRRRVAEVMSVEDQAIANLRIHIRGNHMTLGEEVPRRFPRIFAGENQAAARIVAERPARAGELADQAAITRSDRPGDGQPALALALRRRPGRLTR